MVDASVMPALPRGNHPSATIAIAERMADLSPWRAPSSRLTRKRSIARLFQQQRHSLRLRAGAAPGLLERPCRTWSTS